MKGTIEFEGHVMKSPAMRKQAGNVYNPNEFVCAFPNDYEFFEKLRDLVQLDLEGKVTHSLTTSGQRMLKCKLVFEVLP